MQGKAGPAKEAKISSWSVICTSKLDFQALGSYPFPAIRHILPSDFYTQSHMEKIPFLFLPQLYPVHAGILFDSGL